MTTWTGRTHRRCGGLAASWPLASLHPIESTVEDCYLQHICRHRVPSGDRGLNGVVDDPRRADAVELARPSVRVFRLSIPRALSAATAHLRGEWPPWTKATTNDMIEPRAWMHGLGIVVQTGHKRRAEDV